MTTIEGGGIFTFLTVPPIPALGDRVYPRRLPREATMPALVYRRIDTTRDGSHSGPTGLATPRFQLDIWAADPDAADAIAEAVRIRVNGYRGAMGDVPVGSAWIVGDIDADDEDLGFFRRILDAQIQHQEAIA